MRYLLLLSLLLVSCAASEQAPAYVMTVENRYGARCSGSAIDATHVLTAGHCVEYTLDRVRTSDHTIPARPIAVWIEIDTALYETAEPMNLTEYATPGDFDPLTTGYLFGSCGAWNSSSGRFVNYVGIRGDMPYCGHWQVEVAYSCSGDSGGIVEQNDNVVGMMVSMADWRITPDMRFGNQLCIVPTAEIQQRLVMWRKEN